MKKIYTAALYSRRADMLIANGKLMKAGYAVTARWVTGAEEKLPLPDAAMMDVSDIMRADILLLFTEPLGSMNVGGGRHWEFGYAYGIGKKCVIIGDREQIFCNLPEVRVFETLEDFIQVMDIDP